MVFDKHPEGMIKVITTIEIDFMIRAEVIIGIIRTSEVRATFEIIGIKGGVMEET